MPWIYHQATGEIYHNDELITSDAYAGKGAMQNKPTFEQIHDGGPLPKGIYAVSAPFHHSKTGAYSMRLTPSPGNHMFGRSGFLIHGANMSHPLDSSDGCIVVKPSVRQAIWGSGDHVLKVVQ